MLRWILVLCGAGVCLGLECEAPHSSGLKFNLRSVRNESGHWIAQMQLGHDAGDKSTEPVDIDIDHTTIKCENLESILITAKITAPPTTPIKTLISRGVPTAPGYEFMPGLGYYKLHTDVNTWHGALKLCELEGAHLAVLNSEKEAQALKLLWGKTPDAKIVGGEHTDWAWVGFHDLYKEGEYVTIFNESLKTSAYNKFHQNGAKGGTANNCGLINRVLELHDYPCARKDAYFCEKEL